MFCKGSRSLVEGLASGPRLSAVAQPIPYPNSKPPDRHGLTLQCFSPAVGQDPRSQLTSRLNPLLYRGIEDVLRRWQITLNPMGVSDLVVVAPINGFYRVVGATLPPDSPLRQNNSKIGEGTRGFFAERKVAGYTHLRNQPAGGKRQLFDRHGQVFGEITSASRMLTSPSPFETRWHFYRPVFEKSVANPWSDRVVGIVIIHSLVDDGDSLFKTANFQQQVDAVATEVSPYLDAIQVLTGEEKL